jgi:hypothetical protein
MKNILLIISLLFVYSICLSQEQCGTMILLEREKNKNPKSDSLMFVFENNIRKWIKKNHIFPIHQNNKFPLIDGFLPSGDTKLDKLNFANAKMLLYRQNPKRYLEMTRNVIIDENSKLERQKKSK